MTDHQGRQGPGPQESGGTALPMPRRTLLRAGGVLGAVGALSAASARPAAAAGQRSRHHHWLRPGEDGYEDAVSGFNVSVSRRPEAVVPARDARDVQDAVRYANRHDLPVAVMATGHQASVSFRGGILVSTAALESIRVDPLERTARVGAGVRWGAAVEQASKFGLGALAGSSGSVGVVGYTLGGGLSPALGRRYGYAADHVSRFDMVTADGEFRRVTPDAEPDLFWAALGGKGNFGIVTAMEFGLFPARTLYAGALLYAAEAADEVLPVWRDWAASMPETMTTSAAFVQIPRDADVPDEVRGRLVLSVRVSFLGKPAAGAALVRRVRGAGRVLLDTVKQIPFTDWGQIHSDPKGPANAYERTGLLDRLPDRALEKFVEIGGVKSGSPMSLTEIRQLGGALSRQPDVPNAVGHRDAGYTLFTIGVVPPGQVGEVRAYGARLIREMRPWSTGGAYVNFMSSDEAEPRDVRRAYAPDIYRRLARVKRDVDARNMFRLTHNIPPRGA